ncbi:MAG: hypothetical protein FHK79_18040 [Pseudomonas sp.]|nr:MAG: hypothetical protein FHK79_18040 [Pseudomonas sp.]
MQFINNWSRAVTLAPGVTSLSLDLPDGDYRLTLADSQFTPTRWEIVGATVAAGTATLARGLEGTTDQDWPTDSIIYCTVTAGLLADLFSRLAATEGAITTNQQAIAALDSRVTALEPAPSIVISSPEAAPMGYSAFNGFGVISPAGATVYPGGGPSVDGLGEITELAWSGDYPYYEALQLRVRGTTSDWPSPASLPFETLTIGATIFAKSDLSAAGAGDGSVVFAWHGVPGPFVAGDNTVTFA